LLSSGFYGKVKPDDTIAHEKTYKMIDNFCREFIEKNKSINCYELLGCDMAAAKEKGLFFILCKKYVKDSAEILESLLLDEKD